MNCFYSSRLQFSLEFNSTSPVQEIEKEKQDVMLTGVCGLFLFDFFFFLIYFFAIPDDFNVLKEQHSEQKVILWPAIGSIAIKNYCRNRL